MKKLLLLLFLFISCLSIDENQALLRSRELYDKHEDEKAIEVLSELESRKALFNKAIYLSEAKEYEDALKILDYLIKTDAKRLQYLKLKAFNLNELKRYDEAFAALYFLYQIKPLDLDIAKKYIEVTKERGLEEEAKRAAILLYKANIDKDYALSIFNKELFDKREKEAQDKKLLEEKEKAELETLDKEKDLNKDEPLIENNEELLSNENDDNESINVDNKDENLKIDSKDENKTIQKSESTIVKEDDKSEETLKLDEKIKEDNEEESNSSKIVE